MTMHTQILLGITNAMECAREDGDGSPYLTHLTDADVQLLAREVLTALSEAPDGTPAPTVTVTPAATPMLVLSPADVVARYASDALNDVSPDAEHDDEQITHESWATGDDIRAFRELLFRIQPLFGVRIRSNVTTASLLVAGTSTQVRAFQRVAMMLRDAADPLVATMTPDEQKVFYATLGTLIADHEDADHLIESNRGLADRATAHLNREYGPARNLRRATPATHGDLYDAAQQVAPVRLPLS